MSSYSELDIGTVPPGWKVKTLLEIANCDADIVGGPFGSNLKVSDYRDEGFPIIRLQNVDRNRFIHKDIKYVSKSKANELDYHSFIAGDIILAKLGDPIGKTCTVPDDLMKGVVTADVVRIRTNESLVDKLFIVYSLNSNATEEQFKRNKKGTTRPRVNVSDVRSIVLLLPPLQEQKKIATVLSAVQEAKEKTENVLSALKELKKSMMKHLFTYGAVPFEEIGKVKLKETEIGLMPETWEVVRLGNVVRNKIKDGVHQTPKYIAAGIPFITAKDIVKNKVDFKECRYISEEEHVQLSKSVKPEKGDVLLTKVGTVGNIAIVKDEPPFSIFVQLALIKPDTSKVIPYYLKHVLMSDRVQQEIKNRSSQSTMKFIGVQKIAEIHLPQPPKDRQLEISETLSAIDGKIEAEENKKNALDTLFKTLLSLLMTGKQRVNQLEI